MADEAAKAVDSAEQAYAAAAEAVPAKPAATDETPVKAVAPKATPVKAAPPKAPAPAAAPAKAAPKPVVAKAKPAKPAPKPKAPVVKAKPAAVKPAKAVPKKTVRPPIKTPQPNQTPQAKEPVMAKPADFTKTVTDTMTEIQTRAKDAYDKSTAMAGEATEFTKGNIEALVESSKILTENLQEFGKAYVDEAKAAFETITADMKEMAAVKSPTELFQLQGKLMRRNFDSMVAFGSKSSEAMVKLTNEAMAPLSSRMSLAADKLAKAA
jgi:phasin family protein